MEKDLGSAEQNGAIRSASPTEQGIHPNNEWIQNAIAEHESSLLRYAYHFVHDLETARDVVQDTFLQLCRQTDESIKTRLPQWLFTVCRNRAIDICRKEGRMKSAPEDLLVQQTDPIDSPNSAIEKQEDVAGLSDQIQRLPDNQQEVLRLKFHGGLSYQQIADVTGLSKTNVGFLLHTAIKKLRERLSMKPA